MFFSNSDLLPLHKKIVRRHAFFFLKIFKLNNGLIYLLYITTRIDFMPTSDLHNNFMKHCQKR